LSKLLNKYNSLILIIDKFFKRITTIIEKTTFLVKK